MQRLPFAIAAIACLAPAALAQHPASDQGAVGAWQKLLKVRTTASAMHTTAHPDDEHGGVLAMLSRGQGARVTMLTLTRGESGDNALGPELFDALGLIRTEELMVANRFYGVDRQYFTTAVDYGFSKRLDEALEKWGKEQVLREVVRVIRIERPLVLIARFQGNPRDGHGNHEAAGLITREAFSAAGDPKRFPEDLASGLKAWQPLKLYMGGVRQNEAWTLQLDPGDYDPVSGDSFQTIARLGLGFQRSQNSGRFSPQPGPSVSYYTRLQSVVDAPGKETSFFDGIDVTIPGIYRALKKSPPSDANALLATIAGEIEAAVGSFRFDAPSASVPALTRALAATRIAIARLGGDPDVRSILAVKEEQLADAIHAALGIVLTATAQPAGLPAASGPFGAGPSPMPPVVRGQVFEVKTTFVNRSPLAVKAVVVDVESRDRDVKWTIDPSGPPVDAAGNRPQARTIAVTVPHDASLTRPYFSRTSIQEARYTVSDESQQFRPAAECVLTARARYEIEGVPVEIRRPVVRVEPNLPYGFDTYELSVVPALSVALQPAHSIVPLGKAQRKVRLTAEILNNRPERSAGTLTLRVPSGWRISPVSHSFHFARPGERATFVFDVAIPALDDRDYRVEAIASSGGREYREGYTTIRHRDLESRVLYREAVTSIRGIDVRIATGLKVGYVMGIGDEVPSGLAQLGVEVEMLDEQELAGADLGRFSAIMIGTRAYAVREDLKTYNRRLLEYVNAGGNLIVLYNTQEFLPALYAPYPAELPRTAEEVSEEDSPVEILAPRAAVFSTPNRITTADFQSWVEQRGSKFWTTWDARYTPLIATWDRGQAPQRGGWLHTRYGKGHYTYFAYAFHRQLPYGVPGAYRLLANLLSLNQQQP